MEVHTYAYIYVYTYDIGIFICTFPSLLGCSLACSVMGGAPGDMEDALNLSDASEARLFS